MNKKYKMISHYLSESKRYTKTEIKKLVIKALEDALKIKIRNVKVKLSDITVIDSLDILEIVMAIEEKFEIEIADEVVDKYVSDIGDKLSVQNFIDMVTEVLSYNHNNVNRDAMKMITRIKKKL